MDEVLLFTRVDPDHSQQEMARCPQSHTDLVDHQVIGEREREMVLYSKVLFSEWETEDVC